MKNNNQWERYGDRVKKQPASARIREFHDTVRESVQLAFYLVLSGLSLGMVLVGAWQIRFWLG